MEKIVNKKISKDIILNFVPYIFCFFIFSFLGWVMETAFCYGLLGQYTKRGFLYSPICPIYGTGALILTIYLDKTTTHKNYSTLKNYIKFFILFTIVFSFFEYLVGFALDALFSARWWDYSDSKYNLNGRITLFNSFCWGVITILFVRFIYPLIKKFNKKIISKIPNKLQIMLSIIFLCGILVDFIMSCIKYLK